MIVGTSSRSARHLTTNHFARSAPRRPHDGGSLPTRTTISCRIGDVVRVFWYIDGYGERWFVASMGVEGLGGCALFRRLELRQGRGFRSQTVTFCGVDPDARSADGATTEDPRTAGACPAEFVTTNSVGNGGCGCSNERSGKDRAAGSKRNGSGPDTAGKTQADRRAESP